MSFVQNSKELCHCFVLSVANNLETVSHFAKAILGAQSSDKRSTTKRMTIIIVLCIWMCNLFSILLVVMNVSVFLSWLN